MNIKEGSRVCCLGDSLTEMGFWIYDINGYLSKINSKTRFYNCGIGGNAASNAPYYLEEEVLKYNPDYVLVMFGANDLGAGIYGTKERNKDLTPDMRKCEILRRRNVYELNIKIIIHMLLQRNVKVILMTPMPFDDYERQVEREILCGASDELERYGGIIKKIADEFNISVIDQFTNFRAIEDTFEKEGVRLFLDDRVHPNEQGQRIMAATILNYFGYDISIPKSKKDLNELPFYKTKKNDQRFEIEQALRCISFLEYGRYNFDQKKKYYQSWEEVAADLTKRCFNNDFEFWENIDKYKERALKYIMNRPRKEELRRNLIQKTELM